MVSVAAACAGRKVRYTRHLPGRASLFIRNADSLARGTRVLLALRVSWHVQERNGHLARQEAVLRGYCRRRGLVVVGDPVRHVGSGKDTFWLSDAVDLALKYGAVIL